MDIPRYLQLYKEQRFDDAFMAVIMDNPLPSSTGRVCQHPCESRCRRKTLDEPVNMREVHRFIGDTMLVSDRFEEVAARVVARKLDPTGRKIAIVGAGPAGLTAAFYLSILGHDVTVYDAKPEAGGMLAFAIPEYRLPKAVLRREIELIERTGVKFVLDTRVGPDISLSELDDRYDSVFLSFGTWKEAAPLREPGAELKGVYPALHFLEAVARGESVQIGRRVVVIGGGNAAIDSARTAMRKGAEATVIYRRERKDMPAIAEETHAAKEEGAKFVFLAAPHRIVGDDQGRVKAIEVVKTRLGEFDASGRRKPISTGEIQRYDCDSVIFAIGENVDIELAQSAGLKLSRTGTIEVNRYSLASSRPKFFAGGDVVTGASNVSGAMSYGKLAAKSIDRQLMEADRWKAAMPDYQFDMTPPDSPSESRRNRGRELDASVRAKSEDEVVAMLSHDETLDECQRCLRCDLSVANAT
jgi:NADH-quinone oxidoreductase subunit F